LSVLQHCWLFSCSYNRFAEVSISKNLIASPSVGKINEPSSLSFLLIKKTSEAKKKRAIIWLRERIARRSITYLGRSSLREERFKDFHAVSSKFMVVTDVKISFRKSWIYLLYLHYLSLQIIYVYRYVQEISIVHIALRTLMIFARPLWHFVQLQIPNNHRALKHIPNYLFRTSRAKC